MCLDWCQWFISTSKSKPKEGQSCGWPVFVWFRYADTCFGSWKRNGWLNISKLCHTSTYQKQCSLDSKTDWQKVYSERKLIAQIDLNLTFLLAIAWFSIEMNFSLLYSDWCQWSISRWKSQTKAKQSCMRSVSFWFCCTFKCFGFRRWI